MTLYEIFNYPLLYLINPEHRIFAVYWISAIILSYFVFKSQEGASGHSALNRVFDKRVWVHQSAVLDFKLMAINIVLKTILFSTFIFTTLFIAKLFFKYLTIYLGINTNPLSNKGVIIVIYTLTHFVILDFARFCLHVSFHKIPFLWHFHKVHHSAQVLNPISLYRTHPLESLVSSLLRMFVSGCVAGLFIYLTQSRISILTIMGVNSIDFIFNLLGSNLRHSHVWLSFGPLNRIFVSPAHHQVHHSRSEKHNDKNFGFSLSVWDQLLGTYYPVNKKEFLIFGVRGELDHRLIVNIFKPIQVIIRPLKKIIIMKLNVLALQRHSSVYQLIVNKLSRSLFLFKNLLLFRKSNSSNRNQKEIKYV